MYSIFKFTTSLILKPHAYVSINIVFCFKLSTLLITAATSSLLKMLGNKSGFLAMVFYSLDANKMKVYSKLDELKKILNNAEQTSGNGKRYQENKYALNGYSSNRNIDRLENSNAPDANK